MAKGKKMLHFTIVLNSFAGTFDKAKLSFPIFSEIIIL